LQFAFDCRYHDAKATIDQIVSEWNKEHQDDAPETIDANTKIPSSNIGYKMLLKMGWKDGVGLGKNLQGRKEPVPQGTKGDFRGLGRVEQDNKMAEEATSKRYLFSRLYCSKEVK